MLMTACANLTGLSFKLRKSSFSKGGKRRKGQLTAAELATMTTTPMVFWWNRDKMLAGNLREVERPRQIDVHN
jgi:hypothetical protein